MEVNLLLLCYRVWTGPTNHVTKHWYSSTLKVTFIWQSARLWSKGLWYSAAIFGWGITADAEHETLLSGPAFGNEIISLSVCMYKSLTGFWARGSVRPGLKEAISEAHCQWLPQHCQFSFHCKSKKKEECFHLLGARQKKSVLYRGNEHKSKICFSY